MAIYLLDTNHLSPLVTVNHPLRSKILERIQLGDEFALCTPVITETLYGIGILPRAQSNLAEWEQWRTAFLSYHLDDEAAERAAYLQLALRKKGWQLKTVDALIATVALKHDLILLTTDRDFSQVEGLKIENWRK